MANVKSNSEIFIAAHKYAKEIKATNAHFTYRECFAIALKTVHNAAKQITEAYNAARKLRDESKWMIDSISNAKQAAKCAYLANELNKDATSYSLRMMCSFYDIKDAKGAPAARALLEDVKQCHTEIKRIMLEIVRA